MTSEQAWLIVEDHELDKLLRDKEEVAYLEENNPDLLVAYRALVSFARETRSGPL